MKSIAQKLENAMKWNETLSGLLAGSAICLATASAYAMPKGPCDKKPEVCCQEPRPGPFGFAFPKDIDLNCPQDFFIYVEGLALQAKEDGLDFALSNASAATLPLAAGEVLSFSSNNHDFDYNPGIRVGMGFYVHHDAWCIDFDWTWVNITNRKSYNAEASQFYYPLYLIPNLAADSSLTSVSAVWNSHYNTLDANLGKPYHVSRHLILNPHFGLRAAWIDQHFGAHYGGTIGGTVGAIQHADNDFWGFGTRAGLKSEWIIGKGWSLFGNVAASLLFGQFNINQKAAVGTDNNEGFDVDYDFYQNVPNAEMEIGISWQKYFNKNKYRISVNGSYEFHEWRDQNNLRKFYSNGATDSLTGTIQTDTVSRGNLTLNGFALSLRFDI